MRNYFKLDLEPNSTNKNVYILLFKRNRKKWNKANGARIVRAFTSGYVKPNFSNNT